jgi:hypothetical protein
MLTPAILSDAQCVARAYAEQISGTSFVIASGSLIEGFGNSLSDVDMYIVGKSPQFDGRELHTVRGSTKYELTLLDALSLKDRLESCCSLGCNSDELIDPYDALLAHRFMTGLPLINEHLFQAFMSGYDPEILALRIAVSKAEASFDAFQDFVGIGQSGDYSSAALAARLAADHSLDMLLSLEGDTSTLNKWRLKRLARHDGLFPEIARQYHEVIFPFCRPEISSEIAFSNACLRLFQDCHAHMVRKRFGLQTMRKPQPGLSRHPLCYLRAQHDRICLVCPRTTFQVSATVASQLLAIPISSLTSGSFDLVLGTSAGLAGQPESQLRQLIARGIITYKNQTG